MPARRVAVAYRLAHRAPVLTAEQCGFPESRGEEPLTTSLVCVLCHGDALAWAQEVAQCCVSRFAKLPSARARSARGTLRQRAQPSPVPLREFLANTPTARRLPHVLDAACEYLAGEDITVSTAFECIASCEFALASGSTASAKRGSCRFTAGRWRAESSAERGAGAAAPR